MYIISVMVENLQSKWQSGTQHANLIKTWLTGYPEISRILIPHDKRIVAMCPSPCTHQLNVLQYLVTSHIWEKNRIIQHQNEHCQHYVDNDSHLCHLVVIFATCSWLVMIDSEYTDGIAWGGSIVCVFTDVWAGQSNRLIPWMRHPLYAMVTCVCVDRVCI